MFAILLSAMFNDFNCTQLSNEPTSIVSRWFREMSNSSSLAASFRSLGGKCFSWLLDKLMMRNRWTEWKMSSGNIWSVLKLKSSRIKFRSFLNVSWWISSNLFFCKHLPEIRLANWNEEWELRVFTFWWDYSNPEKHWGANIPIRWRTGPKRRDGSAREMCLCGKKTIDSTINHCEKWIYWIFPKVIWIEIRASYIVKMSIGMICATGIFRNPLFQQFKLFVPVLHRHGFPSVQVIHSVRLMGDNFQSGCSTALNRLSTALRRRSKLLAKDAISAIH